MEGYWRLHNDRAARTAQDGLSTAVPHRRGMCEPGEVSVPTWSPPAAGIGFDASASRLYAAHVRVTAALDEARQAVAAVTADAADVLDGWVGPAGAAYAAAFERWREGAQLLLSALAESSAGLARAACDYGTAEAVNRAVVLGSGP